MSEPPKWEGFVGRECGEHRTLGARAWCLDCSEYCYPSMPCRGCELPQLRNKIDALETRAARASAKAALADERGHNIRESMRRGDLDDWLARYDALDQSTEEA